MTKHTKLLVISADYPGPDIVYGDVFVHTRAKQYALQAEVKVIGYNGQLKKNRSFEYEGISVNISNNLDLFHDLILAYDPDLIVCHFIQHSYVDILLSLKKPLLVFVHGFEALSWKRRLMNYRTPGDLPYLWSYIKANTKQLAKFKELVQNAVNGASVHFVFVSKWLHKSVESDLGIQVPNAHVIPNGINTDLFAYMRKKPEDRKKILLLRSFRARNYANDLAVEAILLLSRKYFFNDLEFSIYGEGYLFDKITKPLRNFANVRLENHFIENASIPELHKEFGIFLCPSRLDTQGVSMCEAMASGLVPITRPVGGIPEYTEHKVSSIQVNTPAQIAASIEHLYHNSDEFLRMSENARLAIETRCSLFNVVPKELELMEQLIRNKNEGFVNFKQCTNCLLDSADDTSITFDNNGVCSFCQYYKENEGKVVKLEEEGRREREKIVDEIKKAGEGKRYDCILGVSGGVDSTYLALKAKQLGLRPLAVHFDNGWNSELAISNIENIVTKLGLDLHTHVIDWEEFKNLQLAFLRASVIDIEMITDHAILASLYKIAMDNNIKFILSGVNFVTESILPPSWIHNKQDHLHILAINNLFGTRPLKKFPLLNSFMKFKMQWSGIQSVALLNYFPYVKADVKETITRELQWRDYGGKHYESVFTRFYQGYILPEKFGVDKRKAHLSNLICSGQITKEAALAELAKPSYPEELRKTDYEFVLKKLGLTPQEFETIMQLPVKKHTDYPVDADIYQRFPVLRLFRPIWKAIKNVKKA